MKSLSHIILCHFIFDNLFWDGIHQLELNSNSKFQFISSNSRAFFK
jgi:hypothetical protein